MNQNELTLYEILIEQSCKVHCQGPMADPDCWSDEQGGYNFREKVEEKKNDFLERWWFF